MSKNTILLTIISVLAILGFLTVAYIATNKPVTTAFPKANVVNADDHVKWSKEKKNILIEYSDIQCPACRSYQEFIKSQIETDQAITKNITFVYRHFPLKQHQNAEEAAYAAEAAHKQGKFFEMVDYLFAHQDEWSTSKNVNEYFITAAKELKLDTTQFKTDMSSNAVKQKVRDDTASGIDLQVDSTPTFFLNGRKLQMRTLEDLKQQLLNPSK